MDLASLVSGGLQLKRDVVRGVGNIASSAARAKLAYAGAVAGANTYSLRQHLIGPRHLQTTSVYHIEEGLKSGNGICHEGGGVSRAINV